MADNVTTVTAYVGEDWHPDNEAAFLRAFKQLLWNHGVSADRGTILIAIDQSQA